MTHEEFKAEKARQLAVLKEWENERIVSLVNYPGYAVSSEGDVLSVTRNVPGKSATRIQHGRRLKPFLSGSKMKYLKVCLSVGGRVLRRTVHSLIAEAFHGLRPSGHDVDHKDTNTLNNHVSNIQYLPLSKNRSLRGKHE